MYISCSNICFLSSSFSIVELFLGVALRLVGAELLSLGAIKSIEILSLVADIAFWFPVIWARLLFFTNLYADGKAGVLLELFPGALQLLTSKRESGATCSGKTKA